MVYGWAGTILYVDLSKEKISKMPSTDYTRLFVGQRGTNAKLMYDYAKPGQSCFDPETPIVIGAGVLAGTGILSAAKLEVTSRSPEQEEQGFGNTAFGGSFAPELKRAGYDNIVITGKASEPVYIFIQNDDVTIKDAKSVWGKGVFDTNTILREELGDKEIRVLALGPAGEKLVSSATIEHEYRSGTALGAVFGSKNLKAVVVRGTEAVKVYDPEKILAINEDQIARLKKHSKEREKTTAERQWIDDAYTWWFISADYGEVGHWEGFEWPDIEKARSAPFYDKYRVARLGCEGCPVSDMHLLKIEDSLLMWRCYAEWTPWHIKTTNLEKVAQFTMQAEDLGVEYRQLSKVIAWLMHMYEDGVITAKDTDGIPMERGSTEAMMAVLSKVANREGFGDVLASPAGMVKFAKKLGSKAEEMLVHRRGIIPRSVEYRILPATALTLAVVARGSEHRAKSEDKLIWERYMKSVGLDDKIAEAYERAKKTYGTEKAIIPWEYEGKARLLSEAEVHGAVLDMMGICKYTLAEGNGGEFSSLGAPEAPYTIELAKFNAATGMNVDEHWLHTAGERIVNMERCFLVRDGRTRKMDTIPEMFFKEPIPDGPRKGHKLDKAKFEKMMDEYYTLRGWDVETGTPTRKTLDGLGLRDIADDLDKLGKLPKTKRA